MGSKTPTRGTIVPNGNRLETDTNHEKLWVRLVEWVNAHSIDWECPWCGGEIDAVCDERDGEFYEDTYRCMGRCNLLITFITPSEYTEYWQVPEGLWRVFVESAFGGEWYAPEEADDLVEPEKEQPVYFPANMQGCPEHPNQPYNVFSDNNKTTVVCSICGKQLYMSGYQAVAVSGLGFMIDANKVPAAITQPEIELQHLGYQYKVALAAWADLPVLTEESDKAQDELDKAMSALCAFVVKNYVDR